MCRCIMETWGIPTPSYVCLAEDNISIYNQYIYIINIYIYEIYIYMYLQYHIKERLRGATLRLFQMLAEFLSLLLEDGPGPPTVE